MGADDTLELFTRRRISVSARHAVGPVIACLRALSGRGGEL